MLEFADEVGQRHTTAGEVKTSIASLDELSIHGQSPSVYRTRGELAARLLTERRGSSDIPRKQFEQGPAQATMVSIAETGQFGWIGSTYFQ